MISFEQADATAREGSPFSNSTDGDAWTGAYCGRCVNDKGDGCPLILVALLGKTPAEWIEKDPLSLDRYTCIHFRDEDDGPALCEPTPIPTPDGQEELFDREPFTRPARMFADTKPVEVHQ
ncbi:hypothetical protein [Herbidospora mongoliensis]|uniref:hypothetical protein n=1 Tax=Herbidospora mongoliensis TaxID=688067 RepID=UPI000834FAA5|nr:hypothetical protein [Herbidospora mongoliensis]